MVQQLNNPPKPLGMNKDSDARTITSIEIIALALSLVWLLGTTLLLLLLGPGGMFDGSLQFVMILVAIFMPVAMIWVAATAARTSRVMREESERLRDAIKGLRLPPAPQKPDPNAGSEPSIASKLDEIAAAQRKTETALATFSSIRPAAPVRSAKPALDQAAVSEDQVALPLGTPAEEIRAPLERSDFISALNFPENAADKAGFAALRRALKDRSAAQLIQSAQDVLTLLSQDGIYMDDLRPDLSRPEIWRRFAHGERGRAIASLGGIRDRSSLALTSSRMRSDAIFRDSAHHFLRLFDRMFTQFEENASDAEISELSDTRTARAFMLLGRVAGTFN